MQNILSLRDASIWASKYLNKNVTVSNISYLVQYGIVDKISREGLTFVDITQLKDYYNKHTLTKKDAFIKSNENINWYLAFDKLKEADTTKHVHRLHPYKGKFIPQLVKYFLDEHTDSFKKESYFDKGDIVLDVFSGSGTTLVEANELGINAIGIDISEFNTIISNSKINKYSIKELEECCSKISSRLNEYQMSRNILKFDIELSNILNEFNSKNFPVPDFKYKVRNKIIDGSKYGLDKEIEFRPIYKKLVEQYKIKVRNDNTTTFIEKWTSAEVYEEIKIALEEIEKIKEKSIKDVITLILSRTLRSCRATTHNDLTTLKEPVLDTYYCPKHGKICKPLFSISKWWDIYSKDSIKRISMFSSVRTNTYQVCFSNDSRQINLEHELKNNKELYSIYKTKKIAGIFSSPPYIGLIDYHEQHAYAYELFKLKRHDDLEIGPMYKGQTVKAKEEYIEDLASVLINSKKYLKHDYNVFLVANDKYNLYPKIAKRASMKIVNMYHRPVLNRSEKDTKLYCETIFHLKEDI